MPIVGSSNLDAANTAFKAAFDEVFNSGPSPIAPIIADIVPNDGTSCEFNVVSAYPRVREWVGSKQVKNLRAYKQNIPITKYESTVGIPRTMLQYDKTGAVGRALAGHARSAASWYDDLLIAALVANTHTGYDGVTLLNDAHPNVGGSGTSDNLVTTALSFAAKKTAVAAMEACKDEEGKPLGVFPTHLLVGPSLRQTAFEVTGSDRLVAVDSSGALDATSSVVAVGSLPNYVGGDMTVLVSPYITGTQYFFMDLSKPAKPLAFIENRAPEPIEITDMNASERFWDDEFHFSIESDGATAAGMWQLVYGKVTA